MPRARRSIVSSLIKLTVLLAFITAPVFASDEPAWFWFEGSGDKKLGVEVSLDGVILHRATFPILKRLRYASTPSEKKVIHFSFVLKRAIKWEGYRDDDNVTAAGTRIEADIWQAGADADDFILGLTFEANNQLYMNTLHFAFVGREERSEIEKGLVVRTCQVR